jgi:ligand-binding SRPBCC domain-containing protein
MRESILKRSQHVAPPVDEAFAFFADPRNLAAITPPWLGFQIFAAPQPLAAGPQTGYRLRIKRVPVRWLAEISE